MWNLVLSGTSWASTMIGIFQDDFPMFHFRRHISDFNILNHYKGSYWLRDLNIIFNLLHFCSDMKNRGCWKVFIWSLKQLNNTLPSKLILLSLPFLKLINSVRMHSLGWRSLTWTFETLPVILLRLFFLHLGMLHLPIFKGNTFLWHKPIRKMWIKKVELSNKCFGLDLCFFFTNHYT